MSARPTGGYSHQRRVDPRGIRHGRHAAHVKATTLHAAEGQQPVFRTVQSGEGELSLGAELASFNCRLESLNPSRHPRYFV